VNGLPDGKRGKTLAVAILIVTMATVWFAILSPVLAFYDNNAQTLEQRRELLRRYRSAVDELPRLRAQQKLRGSNANDSGLLLGGGSDAIATAALQATLKNIVEGNGAEIAGASTLPADNSGLLRRVGVRIAFSGDLEVMTTVLLQIQAARPMLSVSNLELHADTAASDGGPEDQDLAATLDVFGFRAG
jgi:general secretion pathway protein M